ncbi:MAG: hypothetical protein JWQ84_3088 [Mucilaginibacter sp.]|jgi:hypothetical protein|nr:hypothetical protein [Mucilaginibacter sp.]
MQKIAQIGYPFQENSKKADQNSILFEGVHI